MTIEVSDDVEQYIREAVESGRFESEGEAIREIVTFYRTHESEVSRLKAMLRVGLDQEAEGLDGPLDFDDVIRRGEERRLDGDV